MELGKTYSRVAFASTTAAARSVLSTGGGSDVSRLHELHLAATTAAGVGILSTTAGASTGTALSGVVPLATLGQINMGFRPQIEGCLATAAGEQLVLKPTASRIFGWAVISKSTV